MGLLRVGRGWIRQRRRNSPLQRFVLAVTLLVPFFSFFGGESPWLLETN